MPLVLPLSFDWALVEVADPAVTEGGGPHWLLVRRRVGDGEYAFYLTYRDLAVGLTPHTRKWLA